MCVQFDGFGMLLLEIVAQLFRDKSPAVLIDAEMHGWVCGALFFITMIP